MSVDTVNGGENPPCLLVGFPESDNYLEYPIGDVHSYTSSWKHIAVTFNQLNNTSKLYINGLLADSDNSGRLNISDWPGYIWTLSNNYNPDPMYSISPGLNYTIDELFFDQRELSPSVISNIGTLLADQSSLNAREVITITITDDRTEDFDGDGLTEAEEEDGVYGYVTSDLDADMDGDGLTDGYEVNISSTDPLDSDTDDDRLTDGYEENISGTNPRTSNVNNSIDGNGGFISIEPNGSFEETGRPLGTYYDGLTITNSWHWRTATNYTTSGDNGYLILDNTDATAHTSIYINNDVTTSPTYYDLIGGRVYGDLTIYGLNTPTLSSSHNDTAVIEITRAENLIINGGIYDRARRNHVASNYDKTKPLYFLKVFLEIQLLKMLNFMGLM